MSSNDTHMIHLSNYEEWFVLYMDDELTPAQKEMVENFLLQHPELQEEMDLLRSTKLPVDAVSFPGKEELRADAMKLNMVDENLLLYIDNELPAAEKKAVEEKIATDQTYRLQHGILQQTKLDATEIIPYPNKKELYRHTEKLVVLKMWMRIAVAVVLVLFATLFFVLNNGKQPGKIDVAVNAKPQAQKQEPLPSNPILPNTPSNEQAVAVNTNPKGRKTEQPAARKATEPRKENQSSQAASEVMTAATKQGETAPVHALPSIKIDVNKLTQQTDVAINNPVAKFAVTSETPDTFDPKNPGGTADPEGDDRNIKRTSAKGFLRKVSRFLERRTGIGTVNADNEILVGAVALKLN